MENNPRGDWSDRLPFTLGRVWWTALELLSINEEVVECLEMIPEEVDGLDISDEETEEIKKKRLSYIEQLAEIIISVRKALPKSWDNMFLVEDELAAAANGIAQWEEFAASSIPRLTLRITEDWLHNTLQWIAAAKLCVEFPRDVTYEQIDGLTESDIKEYADKAIEILKLKPLPIGVARMKMVSALQQEVCRAHYLRYVTKHSYPIDEEKGIISRKKVDYIDNELKRRPAYNRDHLWLKWAEEEQMTPAKIRDRWNSLSKEQRERICPLVSSPIGKGSPGRDVVKKALEKAKKENIA